MHERRRATPRMRELYKKELTLRDGSYMLTRPRMDEELFRRKDKYILISNRAFPEVIEEENES